MLHRALDTPDLRVDSSVVPDLALEHPWLAVHSGRPTERLGPGTSGESDRTDKEI